jgi:protein CpxP
MGHCGAFGAARFGLRQFDLTEAQHGQIRALFQSHRDEFTVIRERTQAARKKMRAATTAEAIDEAAIRDAATELAGVQADAAVVTARLRQEVLAVLTPEQREKAKNLRADLQGRMKERRQRLAERLKQRGQGQPQ